MARRWTARVNGRGWRARGLALTTLLLTALLLATGCARSGAQRPAATATGAKAPPTPTPTAPPTPTPTVFVNPGLPAFSDWRVAYVGADTVLHAVTLDGATDVTGPTLPLLSQSQTTPGLAMPAAKMGPDGHTLVYEPVQLVMLDTAHPQEHLLVTEGAQLAVLGDIMWSPDGTQFTAGGDDRLFLVRVADGRATQLPSAATHEAGYPVGWSDATHLLAWSANGADFVPDPYRQEVNVSIVLRTLDVVTGATRVLATVRAPGHFDNTYVSLSPDGRQLLVANLRFQDDPAFGAVAQVVDTVTGAVRSLDGILRTTGAQFGHFAWQPGTERVAVTATVGGVTTSWLLDLDRDVASRLALDGHQYVTGWSPDGAALIVTTNRSLIGDLGAGPDTLSAVTFSATGQPHLTTLTQAAYTFPFVGFVRTA